MATVTSEPTVDRMPWPGYEPDREGASLLPWSWAVERMHRERRFWLATTRADGTPHLMPVWAVWSGEGLAFSTGRETRKARNLAARPRCSISTESGGQAVVVDGVAEVLRDPSQVAAVDAAYAAKYGSSLLIGDSPVYLVRPLVVLGLVDSDPAVIPSRWRFPR
jgi:PPOX class probable F420-dependent enzyme